MSGEKQIRRLDDAEYLSLPPAPAPQPEQVNLFRLVHRLLRGRYALTVALSLVCGALGLVGGYLSSTPRFRAEGMIRIQPVLPKILYESEQSTLQPMFSSFVSTQANLLKQDRVIERAMKSDPWKALKRPPELNDQRKFTESLKVATARESAELIFVSFTDKDARAAFTAVREVISAYQELYGGTASRAVRELQLSTLNQRRQVLDGERRVLEQNIKRESAEFETSDLDRLHSHYLDQQLDLDTRVGALIVQLAERGIDPKAVPDVPADSAPVVPGVNELTAEEIALVDRQMAEYFAERAATQKAISRFRAEGVGEKHSDFARALSDLRSVEQLIDLHTRKWNDAFAGGASGTTVATVETPTQLMERYRILKLQAEAWRKRTEDVSRAKDSIDGYKKSIQDINTALAEVNQRLDAINIESTVEETGKLGRIEPFPPETPPSMPTVDSRVKLAAMGFVAGSGLPVALFMLLGLLDRRLRYSDQADTPAHAAPMLGILPQLPDKSADPTQVAAAIHAVHNIRTLLQLSTGAKNRVYAITSPTAGDGKTSLALSLAMSFAAAGSRTALVDFDLVGQGLSSRLRLDPVHGIGEALAAGHLNGSCTITNPFPGLSVIGPRPGDVGLVSRISSDNVAAVLDELRGQYDTVIVDTGPILGSLEATMTAAAADGVVLVVGRGQHQPNIQAALAQLAKLRANCVGLVFNRAHSADFNRSAGTASIRSVRTADIQRVKPRAPDPALQQLDPLARSMASELHPAADQ